MFKEQIKTEEPKLVQMADHIKFLKRCGKLKHLVTMFSVVKVNN